MSTSGAIRKTAQDAVEPLLTALDHIEKQGSLLRFTPDRAQRLGLMIAMTKKGLVAWNATAVRYELTALGDDCLAEYRKSITLQAKATA
jgi:hypothetical protein